MTRTAPKKRSMTEEIAEATPPPRKIAIWDLPTRLFHWTLVVLIAFSWWTAEEHHDDLRAIPGAAGHRAGQPVVEQ